MVFDTQVVRLWPVKKIGLKSEDTSLSRKKMFNLTLNRHTMSLSIIFYGCFVQIQFNHLETSAKKKYSVRSSESSSNPPNSHFTFHPKKKLVNFTSGIGFEHLLPCITVMTLPKSLLQNS